MTRLLPVEWHGGHMIVDPFPGSGLRGLIDTGAGHTASHRKGDGYLGKTLADIERMAGTRLDLLVGLDAFQHQPVMLAREYVEFGALRPDGIELPMTQRSGLVTFKVDMLFDWPHVGQRVTAFFDSGAEKSYVDPSLVGSFRRVTDDFFPPIGKYRAFQFTNRVLIGENEIELQPIVAADQKIGVTNEHRPLLIGSELIRNWGDLWIDMPNNVVVYRPRPLWDGEDSFDEVQPTVRPGAADEPAAERAVLREAGLHETGRAGRANREPGAIDWQIPRSAYWNDGEVK